jgi:hypothetical protein
VAHILEALKYDMQHAQLLLRDEYDAKPSPKIELAAERIRQSLSSGPGSTPTDSSLDLTDLPTLFSRVTDRRSTEQRTDQTCGKDPRPDQAAGARHRSDQPPVNPNRPNG